MARLIRELSFTFWYSPVLNKYGEVSRRFGKHALVTRYFQLHRQQTLTSDHR